MSCVDVEKLVAEILEERKNTNKVVDLLKLLHGNQEEQIMHTALNGLCKFFAKIAREKDMAKRSGMSSEMQVYFSWAKDRFHECLDAMVQLLGHENENLRQCGIIFYLLLMKNEVICTSNIDNAQFSEIGILKLIDGLLLHDTADKFPEMLHKLLRLADIRHCILKLIPRCIDDGLKQNMLEKVFSLLKAMSEAMSSDLSESEAATLANGGLALVYQNSACMTDSGAESTGITFPKSVNIQEQKRLFSHAWLKFLRQDLNSHLFKSVLIILKKRIIPNFASPCLLADFLTKSLSCGGGIALLSLNGIFVLMTEHGLEYPQFYSHLYSMIHPRIFDERYQSRFFFLLNLFLSSTHLPAYLVAAFAKKLARLTLVAPTYAQQLLVNFILTLVDRHPSIKVLINRKNLCLSKDLAFKTDPYIASQGDPAQCKAMESSLWELSALKSHYFPPVFMCVKEISKGPNQDPCDQLEESYGNSINLLYKDFADVAMNYRPPQELFRGFEDCVLDLWSV